MRKVKKVNLALQGGGAHGAYTWGVLDKFLEDDRLEFEGLSGTSAGGMNAIATAQGLLEGGAAGARQKLHRFWKGISESNKTTGFIPSFLDKIDGKHGLEYCLPYQMAMYLTKNLTPEQFNPLDINLLKKTVEKEFNFELLNASKTVKVFLSATNVQSAHIRIFKTGELSIETVLATACLPTLFRPVKVGEDYYWDGGYIGNPALFPLTNFCTSPDIIVVQLSPHNRPLPKTREQINSRLEELSLINAMMREMRVIQFITQLIEEGKVQDSSLQRKYMHIVENEETFQDLPRSSTLNTDWDFFVYLFEEGRKSASLWLEQNFEFIGKKTTCDLKRYT